ncbi:MAG TPA: hypothetical protein VF498_04730, partial [Anaerolineales bacterium]
DHFRPVEKPAPPRPRSADFFSSSIIFSGADQVRNRASHGLVNRAGCSTRLGFPFKQIDDQSICKIFLDIPLDDIYFHFPLVSSVDFVITQPPVLF